MSTPTKHIAYRHYCPSGLTGCDRGSGKPRSEKCRLCKARLAIETGAHGVFVWRGDGRYLQAEPVRVYTSPTAADRFCNANLEKNYVVRWIYA